MKLAVCFERRDPYLELQIESLQNQATIDTAYTDLPVQYWEEDHSIANNVQYAHKAARLLTPYHWRHGTYPYSMFVSSKIFFHRDPRFVLDRMPTDYPVVILQSGNQEAVMLFNNAICDGILTPEKIDEVYRKRGRVSLTDFFDRELIGVFPVNMYDPRRVTKANCLYHLDTIQKLDAAEKFRVFGRYHDVVIKQTLEEHQEELDAQPS